MPRSLTSLCVAVCLGAVAFQASGCASSDAATAEASGPLANATYAVPTAPPTLPAGSISDSPASAALFVGTFLDTVNYAYAVPDAEPVRELVNPLCFTCQKWVIDIQRNVDEGVRRDGGNIVVRSYDIVGGVEGTDTQEPSFSFRVDLERLPGESIAPDGTREALDAGTQTVIITMEHADATTNQITGEPVSERWYVREISDPAAVDGANPSAPAVPGAVIPQDGGQ